MRRPRFRCRTSCRWITRAWICPRVISIRVWLGRNGNRTARRRSENCSGASRARRRCGCGWRWPRDFSVLLDVPAKVRPDKEFRAAVEAICGADAIERMAG